MCGGGTATCKSTADDEATLGSLMGEAKGGEATFGSNLRVGNFEKKISEMYGIGVQVANSANTKLSDAAAYGLFAHDR